MERPVHIDINEHEVSEDSSGYPITATKITFYNRGNLPVYIGKIPIVPGANYQVNYEHPHIIEYKFPIRFDTSATPANAATRAAFNLDNEPKLIIQTMTPQL